MGIAGHLWPLDAGIDDRNARARGLGSADNPDDMDRATITSELVSELVAVQFPAWRSLPVQPVDLNGWDNVTFRLGETLSVRLPSADAYAAQVEKEHRWLPVLAPQLPLPIPQPVAKGEPGCGFPRPWSVYRWLDGEPATSERVTDQVTFASDLAAFLRALYQVDSTGGPPAGLHSFHRGGPLTAYDQETHSAIADAGDRIDAPGAAAVWQAALDAAWSGGPVWVHGDIAASNLLVRSGQLHAVIDFGCCAVGDPACDLVIAWTYFTGRARRTFREALELDEATWARGRGWALWKAAITLRRAADDIDAACTRWGWRQHPQQVIADLIEEHCSRQP